MTILPTSAECSVDIAADVAPRRTLAEVIEIARDLALCADAAQAELGAMPDGTLDDEAYYPTRSRLSNAIEAQVAELIHAHRAGQIDAIVAILTAHRARTLRQVAEGMIDLVGQRGAAVARAAVQPHFQGEPTWATLSDLDDLALAALDTSINQALAGVL